MKKLKILYNLTPEDEKSMNTEISTKLDHLITLSEEIKMHLESKKVQKYAEALHNLKHATEEAEKEFAIKDLSQISDIIFREISRRETQGMIIHSSVTITADKQQNWYLNHRFYEEIDFSQPVFQQIADIIGVIQSDQRLEIIHQIFQGQHQFTELKQQLGMKDGTLGHHLEILSQSRMVTKKDRTYSLTPFGIHLFFMALSLYGT